MTWGCVANDGERYGEQVIIDHDLNLKLTTKMLKNVDESTWNTRVYADPIDKSQPINVRVLVYTLYDTQPGKFVGEVTNDQVILVAFVNVCSCSWQVYRMTLEAFCCVLLVMFMM